MNAPPVQYVTTSDGVRIAYATTGEGVPLLLKPGPLSMEVAWGFPRPLLPWLVAMKAHFRLVQYDHRGHGMSARNVEDLSVRALMRDMEAVADVLNLQRFVLFAAVGWGHAAILYALAHPERVRALIILTTPVNGRAWSRAMHDELPQEDWLLFLRNSVPSELTQEESKRYLDATIRDSDPSNRPGQRAALESDLTGVLDQMTTPTLVMHSRDFLQLRPEESMRLAAAIPGARMVLIDGTEVWGDHEQGLRAIDDFIASLPPDDEPTPAKLPPAGLSAREIEVLRLVAAGRTNFQIADELVISPNTVGRHVSNIFDKIGAANRVEAAAYAQRHGLV